MIPEELKEIVPEIADYPESLVNLVYEISLNKYPNEKDKIIRYYYFGCLLTKGDTSYEASDKISISNITLEEKKGNKNGTCGNGYCDRYLIFKNKDDLENKLEGKAKVIII